MTATARNPATIIGRATRYEIGLFNAHGVMVQRLAFTTRKTREAMFSIGRAHYDAIAPLLADLPADWEADLKPGALRFPNGVTVRATGRTERDCAA